VASLDISALVLAKVQRGELPVAEADAFLVQLRRAKLQEAEALVELRRARLSEAHALACLREALTSGET